MVEVGTGITAFKAMIDALRGMLALSKEIKDAAPEGPQKEAFEQALDEFNANAERFKVELAKEWGYPLCQCTFPPTVMLRIDHTVGRGNVWDDYRCPECGIEEAIYR